MKTDELIEALGRLKVQTGSLVCLGCGHEHNCGVHGCAIAREAAVRLSLYEHALEQVAKERDTLLAQLKRVQLVGFRRQPHALSEKQLYPVSCHWTENDIPFPRTLEVYPAPCQAVSSSAALLR